MSPKRDKLYAIIFLACIAGYIWLYFGLANAEAHNKAFEVCFIKHVTNIPCPSCGSTHAVICLTKGQFIEALKFNPFGYIIALIMILAPLWIIADIVAKRETLFKFYQKLELLLKRPKYAIPLVLLVIMNWIWNITKGI